MTRKNKATALILVTILLLPSLFGLAGCAAGETKHTRTLIVMDTQVDIAFYHRSRQVAQTTLAEAFAEMERLENILSRHVAGSDVQRINEAAGREPVQVNPETLYVVQRALEFARLSEGAFDPTVAPLLELWGFGGETPAVPTAGDLARVSPLVDYRLVEVDEEAGTVFLPQADMKLDLGGIAKGYIVDQAQELARLTAMASFVNAGGDISIHGSKPGGGDWRIAVQDPENPREFAAIINMGEGSVATSGDYQRFFEEEGRLYHHILDPHTGRPAFGLASVTIVAGDTLTADALSTAVFVLGRDRGMALIEGLSGAEAVIMDEAGKMFISTGLADRVEVLR